MIRASIVKSMFRIPALAGLGVLAAVTAMGDVTLAQAQSQGCITDAELDAAVGDQIRSGAFAVNTSKLREAPMCSGLTVAQAIQKIAAGAAPAAPRAEPERPPVPATTNAPSAAQTSLPANTTSELLAYAGKYKFDKVKGRTFYDHPAVISAIKNTGAPASVRKNITDYLVSGPIERQGDILMENACYPHSCDTMQYRVIINAVTGVATLCNLENGADWYFGGRATPVNVNDNCVVNSLREAPIDVSRALSSHTTGVAPARTVGAAQTPATSTNLPDITSTLTFYDPGMCSSEKWTDMFYAALDRKPVQVGALGQIKFRRSGPDKDKYITDSASVNAKWNNLTITKFEFGHVDVSDITSKIIVFKDPVRTVQTTLNRLGFNIRKIDDLIEVGNEMPVYITLQPHGSGAMLSCGT